PATERSSTLDAGSGRRVLHWQSDSTRTPGQPRGLGRFTRTTCSGGTRAWTPSSRVPTLTADTSPETTFEPPSSITYHLGDTASRCGLGTSPRPPGPTGQSSSCS